MKFLDDLFSIDDLLDAKHDGFVTQKVHPMLPLEIWTYTRACQYERHWTPVTTRCRGLVVESVTGHIVAWPFPKFFNVSEHSPANAYAPPLPAEPFSVFEKVDGSLGIVFHYDGRWNVASKGSFTSEQATWAQNWLDQSDTSRLEPGITYLCEIVYPENRIVVRYDDNLTGLCLLGAYTSDGQEIPLHEIVDDWRGVGYPVRQWTSMDRFPLSAMLALADGNMDLNGDPVSGSASEGWVIRFETTGIRAKIKFAEYIRLHKVLTGINARDIWQAYGADRFHDIDARELAKTIGVPVAEAVRLAAIEGGAIRPLIDDVPDEFDQWVRNVMAGLDAQYYAMTQKIADYTAVARTMTSDEMREETGREYGPDRRKVFARRVMAMTTDPMIRSGMFIKYDGRDIGPHVWKAIRPAATDPFRESEDA